jgi:hypothetical protein
VISDATLGSAVDKGILTAAQVEQLLSLEREAAPRTEPQDDEKLRFISGFGDVFVTMGLGLFLGALGYFISRAASAATMWIGLAVATWALAEFFTRMRRMALPSIVLLVTFAASCYLAIYSIIAVPLIGGGASIGFSEIFAPVPAVLVPASLATVPLVAFHYWRFACRSPWRPELRHSQPRSSARRSGWRPPLRTTPSAISFLLVAS